MAAFVVFIREETLDPPELAAYSAKVKESFEGHAVTFRAAYGQHEVLEGPTMEGAVLLEFPDLDAARTWYRSPAYQAAARHRFKGAIYRGFIVQGL